MNGNDMGLRRGPNIVSYLAGIGVEILLTCALVGIGALVVVACGLLLR